MLHQVLKVLSNSLQPSLAEVDVEAPKEKQRECRRSYLDMRHSTVAK